MAAKKLLGLARGFPGHPSHPPLTDATIGALSLGVLLALLGWLGVAEEQAAPSALLAIAVGLLFGVPALVTGFLDYLAIPRGTARWRLASVHWLAMIFALSAFLVAAALLQRGYDDGEVPFSGLIAALGAQALLILGGWLGGSLVFVHGERVLDLPAEPAREAVIPRTIEREPVPRAEDTDPRRT